MLIWLTPLQMSLYGGLAVLAALAVRTAGRRRLPSGVLSWLWLLAALRFLLPVSVSGPASVDVSVLLPRPLPSVSLPAPLPVILTAALVAAAIGYIGQLVRVTNRFLRRSGQEKLVKTSRWAVLVPAVGFTCLAILRWMPEQMLAAWWGGGDDWIAQWERDNFVNGATWILIIACLVAYLNYVTQAGQALKYEEIEEAGKRGEAEQ